MEKTLISTSLQRGDNDHNQELSSRFNGFCETVQTAKLTYHGGARGARDGIKPGAQAPGSDTKRMAEPAKRATNNLSPAIWSEAARSAG